MSAPEIRERVAAELLQASRRERRLGDAQLAKLLVSRINAEGNIGRQDLNRWQQIAASEIQEERRRKLPSLKLV